jgi:hypothetical protein
VTFSGDHSVSFRVPVFVGVLCLALALQGAHVCPSAEFSAAGLRPAVSSLTPVCPVCAIAHSLLVTLLLFVVFLIPNYSRTVLISVQAKPFWRGIRLYMRPPPAL